MEGARHQNRSEDQGWWIVVAIVSLVAIAIAVRWLDVRSRDLRSLSDAALKMVTVRMERTACEGTCPAYTITIHGDGRVEYAGTYRVKTRGTQEGRIETAAVRALMAEFVKAKFLSLPDYSLEKCACQRCLDMPSTITEITAGTTSHRVNHAYGCGCAPKALFELESAIDKAANSKQWTGDISHTGPFGWICF